MASLWGGGASVSMWEQAVLGRSLASGSTLAPPGQRAAHTLRPSATPSTTAEPVPVSETLFVFVVPTFSKSTSFSLPSSLKRSHLYTQRQQYSLIYTIPESQTLTRIDGCSSIGDWGPDRCGRRGLGTGDWGLGTGDWGLGRDYRLATYHLPPANLLSANCYLPTAICYLPTAPKED